jgi:putative aldouronate transport system permease protein
MLLPGLIFLLLFSYVPMFGIVIAFENFIPALGPFQSPWVGWANFSFMVQDPDTRQIVTNTVVIAVSKIILELIVPVTFALLLNELRVNWYKRTAQTLAYLPHFLSWVILGGIILEIFDLNGIVNQLMGHLGLPHIWFFGSNTWFRPVVIGTDVWKEFGFATIIYLAALTGINPELYEAAAIDGAGRWAMLRSITLPGIATTIVLLATLSLQNLLNANFDQIFNLYNPLVYPSGDIIDTWVYRTGLVSQQYGLATAVGLLKSVIGFVMIVAAYRLAARFANYRIF